MSFFQSFRLALRSILSSKMRSFLTMLGIIIGVGAVMVIVGLGNGMEGYMTDSFESMGTNLITVTITGRGSSRSVDVNEMYSLVSDNPNLLSYVSPTVSVSGTFKVGTETLSSTTVTGVGEDYFTIKQYNMSSGRFLQYVDILRRQTVCVVGSYIASTYFDGNAVGQTLKINGNTYTIVGVMEEKSSNEEGTTDDAIYIPYTNAAKMSFMGTISNYSFSSTSGDTVEEAKTLIENTLYKTYENSDYYKVVSMSEMLDTMTQMLNILVMVLAAIAAISLIVGGIGIMNIMLVSVTERTREIGIRKSLGAKQRDIKRQFVIEAGTTSAMGGIFGIAFGFILSTLATKIITNIVGTQLTVMPSSTAVLGAFSISVAIGVLFGYLPARKAAHLNPIDALRYD